jgi:hypothetical protein
MRQASLLFILLVLPLFAFSQITIQKSRISVEEVLKEITRQSGMHFSYNPKSIDAKQVIAFRVRKASLEEALAELARKIPIEYTLIEQQIVLNRRREPDKPAPTPPKEPAYYTISGFVQDQSSGESLIGATVFAAGTSQGTTTNAFGFYSLALPGGEYVLEYSYLGFIPEKAEVTVKKDQQKNVGLQNQPVVLPDVLVAIPMSDLLARKQPGQLAINPGDIGQMPEFGGESGLIRGIQSMPGVQTHSDGSAFFFVRGGERDQNLIIIDDAPVYNPAHLFGFYSVVVPEFTKDIKLYKSDIPVHLGDRLSAIVDIRTKDGNLNKWEFGGAFNPLLSRLSLEGPLKKGRSSVFTSLRNSNFQWIYRQAVPDLDLRFGDFNFKWNWKSRNNRDRLFFTLVSSQDVLANTGAIGGNRAGVQWNNFAMALRWNRIFSPRLFSNTILYTGNYQYRLSATQDVWHSGIGSLSLKTDFTWFSSARLTSKFGAEWHGYAFNPGKILAGDLVSLFPTISQDHSRQNVLYYNADLSLSEKWRFNAGVRLSRWANFGPARYFTFDENFEVEDTIASGIGIYNTYWRADPRASLQFRPDSASSLKLSAGIYHQYIQLISNSTSPFNSFEVWLPSSPNIRPQRAYQAALGYVRYLPKQGLELSAEAFYKHMENQIDYEDHPQTLLNPLIEGELRFGRLRAYGLELMLKKERGRLNGWIAYTWSRALRQTGAVNEGRSYPAFQDRPHDLSVMLNYGLSRRTLFSAYWTSYTGSPFSSPTGFYSFNDYTIPIYGEKHNDRLPDYRRLDIAFQFTLNRNPDNRYQHQLTFSIYNVLMHQNIVAVNFNKIEQANGRPIVRANLLAEEDLVTTQTDLIRFLPSLTYTFKL